MAEAKKTKEEKEKLAKIKAQVEAVVEEEAKEVVEEQKSEKTTAKAGRRSAKSVKEAGEKAAKEERRKSNEPDEKAEKPKKAIKPARSRLERRSKKYKEAAKLIDTSKQYKLAEAMELAVKTSATKFDGTIELHINLGVDPRQAEQNIRGTVVLPAGTGKNLKIAVFAEADGAKIAKAAGADQAGNEDFLAKLDKGTVDFDVLITTPQMMAKLAKYARILGPRGLMPNPKSGTVAPDLKKAVEQAKAGRVEYRVDSTGIIHLAIGKVSFGAAKLEENGRAVLASIKAAKPGSLKGNYVKAIYATTTMGPSIVIDPAEL